MYTIDGNNFSDYNIEILSSRGALDIPERLGEVQHNWGDSNGVEAYVLADDLIWNGRMITLRGYYSGSSFISDIETMETALKGSDLTLVTHYGTHSVRLAKINENRQIIANTRAFIDLDFWEHSVTPGTPPVAVGGTGVRLGGYDFLADFGLTVSRVSGYGIMPEYDKRVITYGDSPQRYSAYRNNRTISIHLAGHYASISALVTNINNLKSVLMSAGTKALVYRGVTKTTYFTGGASVEINYKAKTARMILNLKIQE
jgi:hypothetical protein